MSKKIKQFINNDFIAKLYRLNTSPHIPTMLEYEILIEHKDGKTEQMTIVADCDENAIQTYSTNCVKKHQKRQCMCTYEDTS